MTKKPLRERSAAIFWAVLLLALLAVGFYFGMRPSGDRPSAGQQAETPREIWRCHACARVQGKNWQTCRTVTGRGTEKMAQDLVKQRVCEEATDPAAGCKISSMNCRKLSEAALRPRVKVKTKNKARQE